MRKKYAFALVLLAIVWGRPVTRGYAYQSYIDGVKDGSITVCKWVKCAVERHERDLQRQNTDEFPYYFDEKLAQRPIDFIQQLSHTKGKWASTYGGKKALIELEPWEQFIIAELHGWRQAGNSCRRFGRAYIEVARKNGKTTLGAGLCNYSFFADRPGEEGPEIYFGATKQEQAAIAWREAKQQIAKCPALSKRSRVYDSKQVIVLNDDAQARMKPLGRDSDTEDGLNPSVALIDEYHAHPDSRLLEVLESGMGAREQPLLIIITTAGFDKNCPCYQQEHTATERILEGIISPENFFGIIYTIDEGDDWTDPHCWVKANPNLGISINEDYLKKRVELALSIPSKTNEVKTKNLNIWTQAETRWITDEKWMECAQDFTEESLANRACYGGLDLSTVIDITAFCLAFQPMDAGEPWKCIWRFFMPEENILDRERGDGVPYTQWADEGLLILTPGNVVDYDLVEQEIHDLGKRFDIKEICYDPWKAHEIVNHLSDEFVMVETPQRYKPMAIYCDIFEKKLLAHEYAHNGNDMIRWMMSCTEVKADRQGNIMPMKPRRDTSGKRIDGIVASIMAVGRGVAATGETLGIVIPEEAIF